MEIVPADHALILPCLYCCCSLPPSLPPTDLLRCWLGWCSRDLRTGRAGTRLLHTQEAAAPQEDAALSCTFTSPHFIDVAAAVVVADA